MFSYRSFSTVSRPFPSTTKSKAGRISRLVCRKNVGIHRTGVALPGPINRNIVRRRTDKKKSPKTLSDQVVGAAVTGAYIK